MANFTADDLKNNNNYSPTVDGGDNPKYIGVLDRIKVDKSEEYEVVYFCNKFLERYDILQTKESFQKVEKLLRHSDLKSEDNRQKLIDWIVKNWLRDLTFHSKPFQNGKTLISSKIPLVNS